MEQKFSEIKFWNFGYLAKLSETSGYCRSIRPFQLGYSFSDVSFLRKPENVFAVYLEGS